jgi:Uma2 family endonuclease
MAVTTKLLTVDEFARLPQPAGGIRQELHHGELFELPPVKSIHTKVQKSLVKLLEPLVNPFQLGVDKEFPFRPAPEYEVWVADVAIFNLAVWKQTLADDYFRGVPAIVIEVLSPSNSDGEMLDRQETCLRYGGQEFWTVDTQKSSVKVVRADGHSQVHDAAGVLQSGVLNRSISVSEIFA